MPDSQAGLGLFSPVIIHHIHPHRCFSFRAGPVLGYNDIMIESLLLRSNPVPAKMGYWKSDEHSFISMTRRAAKSVARQSGEGGETASISPTGDVLRAELDIGKKQGCSPPPGGWGAGQSVQSIPPAGTPQEFTAPIGPVTYRAVAGCLAGNIAHCLDALLKGNPENIRVTPEWICDTHRCIAGELFAEWAGPVPYRRRPGWGTFSSAR